jgi:hypothetical protein
MGPSTPIAATGSKDGNRVFDPRREHEYPVSFLSRFCTRGVDKAKGKTTFSFCLCLLCYHHYAPEAAARRKAPLTGQRLGLACYDVL